MNRGFMIVAQNSGTTDYIKCAEILCRSLKHAMPTEKVTLLTDTSIVNPHFDSVVTFPHGDQCLDKEWKLDNDWQVYEASPYEYTIKLEADMYITRPIDHWWDILGGRDLVISTTIRNYKNQVVKNRFYRLLFDDNKLPDVYNAVTYFKKSPHAQKFYSIVKNIFENWPAYKELLRGADREIATTDVAYALATRILGEENCTLPYFTEMSMVHMKKNIIDTSMSDWSRELLYEISDGMLRINTIPQLYPVHYHNKAVASKLELEL